MRWSRRATPRPARGRRRIRTSARRRCTGSTPPAPMSGQQLPLLGDRLSLVRGHLRRGGELYRLERDVSDRRFLVVDGRLPLLGRHVRRGGELHWLEQRVSGRRLLVVDGRLPHLRG